MYKMIIFECIKDRKIKLNCIKRVGKWNFNRCCLGEVNIVNICISNIFNI